MFAALERSTHSRNTNAMMARAVGLPLVQAIVACVQGEYRRAIDPLLQIRTIVNRISGSNVQCDLIHLTLTECALKSGDARLARAWVNEREQSENCHHMQFSGTRAVT